MARTLNQNKRILAFDVGERRIGVAAASTVARIASPVCTLQHSEQVLDELQSLIVRESADVLVVGLPRNMSGDETAQTQYCRDFAETLRQRFSLPVYEQDETLTSVQAEAELVRRGKPHSKADIDSLAAVYILEDFLQSTRFGQ